MYTEYETISCEEFRQLLVGLNGDTPLGYTVQIRSEKDSKKINQMSNHEKKMRSDWQSFKLNQNKQKNKGEKIVLSSDEINNIFSKMFG